MSQVAQRLGFTQAFAYQSAFEIFREHAALSGFENDSQHGLRDFDISAFSDIGQRDYDQLQPVQWPVNQAHPGGRARMFDDGHFFTASGKAQFIAVLPRAPQHSVDSNYPLILNTGRLRDQWHTMTRTGLAAKLNQHRPEPWVEINPVDASCLGLTNQDLATLGSVWGNMLARVHITEAQTVGSVFVPMHWSERYSRCGRVGALVNPVMDPISRQPESKHTPVCLKPYRSAWYGFLLSRQEWEAKDIDYWVSSKAEQCFRFELAGQLSQEDWPYWARQQCDIGDQETTSWLEYHDPALGHYRAAQIVAGRLQWVLFIATKPRLPERNWLMSLFTKPLLTAEERKALLTGRPPVGSKDEGVIVCACFQVGENTLREAIQQQGLKTVQEVGRCLRAGTNCGSCVPEIKALLN
jgi:assimilatory nitrate reductase catalytic subunit